MRGRSGRLHEFASTREAEAALAELAGPPDPIVELLEVEPGQKEPRWAHRIGDEAAEPPAAQSAAPAAPQADPEIRGFDPDLIIRRLERLERQVQELHAAIKRRP